MSDTTTEPMVIINRTVWQYNDDGGREEIESTADDEYPVSQWAQDVADDAGEDEPASPVATAVALLLGDTACVFSAHEPSVTPLTEVNALRIWWSEQQHPDPADDNVVTEKTARLEGFTQADAWEVHRTVATALNERHPALSITIA